MIDERKSIKLFELFSETFKGEDAFLELANGEGQIEISSASRRRRDDRFVKTFVKEKVNLLSMPVKGAPEFRYYFNINYGKDFIGVAILWVRPNIFDALGKFFIQSVDKAFNPVFKPVISSRQECLQKSTIFNNSETIETPDNSQTYYYAYLLIGVSDEIMRVINLVSLNYHAGQLISYDEHHFFVCNKSLDDFFSSADLKDLFVYRSFLYTEGNDEAVFRMLLSFASLHHLALKNTILHFEKYEQDIILKYRYDGLKDLYDRDMKKIMCLKQVGDLFQTYELFFSSNGSLADVKNILHIHRNTVSYRMGQISEIIGYDIGQIKNQTYLYELNCLIQLLDKENEEVIKN